MITFMDIQYMVFDEGRAACLGGRPKSDNPHPIESTDYIEWYRGWRMEHELSMVDLKVIRRRFMTRLT